MFNKGSGVVELSPQDFNKKLQINKEKLQGVNMGMVAVVADWCFHCKNLKPCYAKAARKLGKSFNMFYIDAVKHPDLAVNLVDEGFPTIRFINSSGTPKKIYNGERSYEGLISAVCTEALVCFD